MADLPIFSFLCEIENISVSNKYKLKLPRKDFFQGLWQLCISNISYVITDAANEFISVHTNFVTDVKFNVNNEIEPIQSQISFFLLKGILNEKRSYNFEKTWFLINSMTDCLEITLIDAITKTKPSKNVKVFMTVLMRRIK